MRESTRIIRELIHYIIIYGLMIAALNRIDYVTENQMALAGGLVLFIIVDKVAHNVLGLK